VVTLVDTKKLEQQHPEIPELAYPRISPFYPGAEETETTDAANTSILTLFGIPPFDHNSLVAIVLDLGAPPAHVELYFWRSRHYVRLM